MEKKQTRNGKGIGRGTSRTQKTVESLGEGGQAHLRSENLVKDPTVVETNLTKEIGEILDQQMGDYRQFIKERDESKAKEKSKREETNFEREMAKEIILQPQANQNPCDFVRHRA